MDAAPSRVVAALRETFTQTVWAPLFLVLLHFVLRASDVYNAIAALDLAMHFIGGIAISYVAARFVSRAHREALFVARHRVFEALLIVSVTVIAAVSWELLELLLEPLGDAKVENGRIDTMQDLAAGLVGACAFTLVWWSEPRT